MVLMGVSRSDFDNPETQHAELTVAPPFEQWAISFQGEPEPRISFADEAYAFDDEESQSDSEMQSSATACK